MPPIKGQKGEKRKERDNMPNGIETQQETRIEHSKRSSDWCHSERDQTYSEEERRSGQRRKGTKRKARVNPLGYNLMDLQLPISDRLQFCKNARK